MTKTSLPRKANHFLQQGFIMDSKIKAAEKALDAIHQMPDSAADRVAALNDVIGHAHMLIEAMEGED